jgi:hypothetical protein
MSRDNGSAGVKSSIRFGDKPFLQGSGTRSPEAWFLGTKAENAEELERLIVEAIRDHAFWRRNFHPQDPTTSPSSPSGTRPICRPWTR